ncbi:pectin lyase fold/virulence factor [Elsinoe ampelina]|uniref:Pectin lyase fold/virulence factor n=1 Tax=Elsinoe ampelina TaxID=302913 RepID=A0A6A6G3U9_9PEZI|nr:pectin lyase fold/virulence factor [Elsinoe ampelina]
MISAIPAPSGVETHPDYTIHVREAGNVESVWHDVAPILAGAGTMNLAQNALQHHPISVASLQIDGPVEFAVHSKQITISQADILPSIYNIDTEVKESSSIHFVVKEAKDIMLILNDDKWNAVHLLINRIDVDAPTSDTENLWYFGPGINNGTAYDKVVNGKLLVPSNKTVYLAPGAFLDVGLHFKDVSNSGVYGPGFIYKTSSPDFIREKQGAILIEDSTNISIRDVTALSTTGFSFLAGQSSNITISHYRVFTSCGNGDGLHFLSTSSVTIQNCFLRTSDDSIAINCSRWDYHGDSTDYTIRSCVLLPDIAHPILIGTHGAPARPTSIRNIHISDVDVLDHEEHQLWYQGCIALNAGDGNLLEDISLEDVRVRRITRGQLVNIRVMQNAMWTTAPGRGVRRVRVRNLSLGVDKSGVVNASQILGYDGGRGVRDVVFEGLKLGERIVHGDMEKPRWYMVEDFVPVFVNEHVQGLVFRR